MPRPDEFHPIAAAPLPPGHAPTGGLRIAIVLIGIGLPYLARIPGIYSRNPAWLTSYLDTGIIGFAIMSVSGAINWGSILLVTRKFRSIGAILVAAAIGFTLPAYGNATLDLRADALSALAIPMFPIMSLPLVGIGWLVGLVVDRQITRIREKSIIVSGRES